MFTPGVNYASIKSKINFVHLGRERFVVTVALHPFQPLP